MKLKFPSIAMTDILNDKKVIVSKGSLIIAKVVSASMYAWSFFTCEYRWQLLYRWFSENILPVHCLRELGAIILLV